MGRSVVHEKQQPVNIKMAPSLIARIKRQVKILRANNPGPPVMTMSRYIKEAVIARLLQDEHFNELE